MVLVDFSKGSLSDENVRANERRDKLDQIRRNLMSRRDKLSHERLARGQLLSQFETARPKEEMSMHALLSSMDRPAKRTRSLIYVTEDDTVATPADVARGLLCRYSTGKCRHVRAQKTDGTYLNLCHLHRMRANANQRKLDRKKSQRLIARQVQPAAPAAATPAKELLDVLHAILQPKKLVQ
ncbi:hypothetical protein ACHHYP_15995 [Achlya hypogyna]|uniref:Uncharacterized protein n=1 Tax=Achlya hypogyna TaxID=1202772 RepID=A0A1V9ZEE4_ACHHY|nr:hypothetical protein ACHHYP_15995 [Achlya hypogyna]